jgi:hypothetical protein
MNLNKYPNQIPAIYGTFIAIGLIVYFFITYALGFIHVIELRLLNLFILAAGVYFALKQYRKTHNAQLDYFRALTIGVSASFIGTSTFVLFLFLYLKIDLELMETIKRGQSLGPYLNAYIATFAVWMEGIFSGFTATFILINYMDTTKT